MKFLIPAVLTAMLLASPAAAFGPTILLPTLDFPPDSGTLSTQGCDVTHTACE